MSFTGTRRLQLRLEYQAAIKVYHLAIRAGEVDYRSPDDAGERNGTSSGICL